MRRTAPRPLRLALERASREAEPAGALAALQSRWEELVGPVVAAESHPASEREGAVTVACSSSLWAQELELLGPELLARIAASPGTVAVRSLRFVVARGSSA